MAGKKSKFRKLTPLTITVERVRSPKPYLSDLSIDNMDLAKDLIKREGLSGSKVEFACDKMKALFDNDKRKRRRKQGKKRTNTSRGNE